MVTFHAHYTSSFEIFVEAVALLQCRDISHLFRHVSVVWGNFPCASWCHLCHAEDRQRHCLTWQVTKSQWVQSQRGVQTLPMDSRHSALPLAHASQSIITTRIRTGRQITPGRSRENSPCPRRPAGAFPDWKDWGMKGFFLLLHKLHHKMLHFLLLLFALLCLGNCFRGKW